MAKYDLAFQPYHTFKGGVIQANGGTLPAGYVSPVHEAIANKRPWWQAVYAVALKASYVRPSRTELTSLPVSPEATHVNSLY